MINSTQSQRQPIQQTIILLLFLLLFSLPAAMHFKNLIASKGIILSLLYTLFSLGIIILPLLVVRPKLYTIIALPFIFFMPLELIHVAHYDGYSTISGLASAVETDHAEMSGFIQNYRHYFYTLIPLILVLYFFVFFKMRFSFRLHNTVKLLCAFFITAIFLLFGAKTTKDAIESKSPILDSVLSTYARMLAANYPSGSIINIYQYRAQASALKAAMKHKEAFRFNATATTTEPLTIIVIIGETSRRANWQLSQYHRATTPKLSSRNDLLYFTNAISAATQTRESIQLALTRATPENTQPIIYEKSVISAFKEAGFYTAWLSNQPKLSDVDTPTYLMSKEADYAYFTGVDGYANSGNYDETLLDALRKLLAENQSPRRFIVIHTMGSHEVYRFRYPPEFSQFQPASTGDDYNFVSPGIRERLLNSYDNSILYTDHVLNEFINTTQQESPSSIIAYFSDHGENVLDNNSDRFGHGGVIPTTYVTDIPLFLWLSEQYQLRYPEVQKGIIDNLQKPVSTLCLFDSLLAFADVKIEKPKNACVLSNPIPDDQEWTILSAEHRSISYQKVLDAMQQEAQRAK